MKSRETNGGDGSYGPLAGVYDRLNDTVDIPAWADFIEACFERFIGKKPELVLDLACGTGRMTVELARRGYDMIGVDGSPEMLGEASARRLTATNPLYLMQDMRRFELYGSVGAVICCLDSINYLTGEDDLAGCFSCVVNYLDPGGLFLFDVSTPYRFTGIFGENAYILEDAECGVYCGWQNRYSKRTKKCDFLLTVFEKRSDGSYTRFDEVQCERMYTQEQLKTALTAAGLRFEGCFGGFDFREPQSEDERWYIAAVKPEK